MTQAIVNDFRAYCPMDRRPLTRGQLEDHLRRQMQFLRTSSHLYDEGDEHEAIRLATTLRVLLYDHGSSRSLLGQLGHLSLPFIDTCLYRDDFDTPGLELIDGVMFMSLGGQTHDIGFLGIEGEAQGDPRWVPVYNRRLSRQADFQDWWHRDAVEMPPGDRYLSRLDLVKIASNQDGGAHVDPSIDVLYDQFSTEGHQMWTAQVGDGPLPDVFPADGKKPRGSTVAASIRQIAWEVDATVYLSLHI